MTKPPALPTSTPGSSGPPSGKVTPLPPSLPSSPASRPAPPSSKPSSPRAASRPTKVFSVKAFSDADEGQRILIYGKSGTGKTTLASMAPNPVFIAIDDGARKIRNPHTGDFLRAVDGVRDFYDLRDALHQKNLYNRGDSLVIDTITKAEEIVEPYLFANYQQKGKTVTSFRQYGWDGPGYMLDAMRLILTDTDDLIRAGVNVIFLAQLGQVTVANAEGADYLEDGPKLSHTKGSSVRALFCEAADHVVRVGYLDSTVSKDEKDRVGKVTGDATRAIFTGGAMHYMAKSRPVAGINIPPVISFENQQDDSLWKFLSGKFTT